MFLSCPLRFFAVSLRGHFGFFWCIGEEEHTAFFMYVLRNLCTAIPVSNPIPNIIQNWNGCNRDLKGSIVLFNMWKTTKAINNSKTVSRQVLPFCTSTCICLTSPLSISISANPKIMRAIILRNNCNVINPEKYVDRENYKKCEWRKIHGYHLVKAVRRR